MRVVVTGASGLLGREIVNILSRSHTVSGWAHRRAEDFHAVNLLDPVAAEQAFKAFRPEVLVHAAAQRRPDSMQANPEESWALNVSVPRDLSLLCASAGTSFYFISTDYVFDGVAPPYAEEAAPHPLNLYGKSKAAAEEHIRTNCQGYCIVRVPILYGPSADAAESAITILLEQLRADEHKEIFFDDGAIRYPTLTTDVARALAFLIERKAEGVYHYTAEQPYTKYGMAVVMASILGHKALLFPAASQTQGAKRPLNSHLDNTKIRRLGFESYTPFREGISSVLAGLEGSR